MADKKIDTGSQVREGMGIGSVLNAEARDHQGFTKRPFTEDRLISQEESADKKYMPKPAPTSKDQFIPSEDGSEILRVVNGVVVERKKRLPPGLRQQGE